jgi:HAD superfamily hydrolase (TIGR01509 family)
MSDYLAVVFDMDGVLVDTEMAFFGAVNEVLEPTGKQIAWDDYKHLLGTSVDVTRIKLAEMLDIEGSISEVFTGFSDVLLARLSESREPLLGVLHALDGLSERGVPHALATSSTNSWKSTVLRSAGLHERFPIAVTADDLTNMKPAPDIYLRAAELLAIAPERCIAIEDTIPGITSAKAAGMYAIQVRASSTALPPIDAADAVLDSLEQFPFELLASR